MRRADPVMRAALVPMPILLELHFCAETDTRAGSLQIESLCPKANQTTAAQTLLNSMN
jgi:hypothetical protein